MFLRAKFPPSLCQPSGRKLKKWKSGKSVNFAFSLKKKFFSRRSRLLTDLQRQPIDSLINNFNTFSIGNFSTHFRAPAFNDSPSTHKSLDKSSKTLF